jgi:very-short-patch-repair endonuclease
MSQRHLRHRHNVPAARALRTRETTAEDVLWEALRGRRLHGLKFRRQHPVGPFVLDFCCAERHLAIELDGGVHAQRQEQDAERAAILAAAGYRLLRFPNDAVTNRLDEVLAAITAGANDLPMWRPPVPGRRAGM